jgi:GNAT superfamily N-acetyltransferase
MRLSNQDRLSAVRAQLAVDLNCLADDFDRAGFVFCEAKENPGRRPFPRGERHFEMLTMGGAVIVSATPDILPYVREQLDGKNSDEAFNMPFVHGQGVCFIPDNPRPLTKPEGFDVEVIERDDILKLYDTCQRADFPYALSYNANHPRPDVLAVLAMADGNIAGIAGVSADCEMLWQIGINVQPEHRQRGIAAALTNRLAMEVLERGKIPYYATAPRNIGSQRVAYRAGFKPAWTCVYRGRFDDALTSPTG